MPYLIGICVRMPATQVFAIPSGFRYKEKNSGGVPEETHRRYLPTSPDFPLKKIAADWKKCGTRIKLLRYTSGRPKMNHIFLEHGYHEDDWILRRRRGSFEFVLRWRRPFRGGRFALRNAYDEGRSVPRAPPPPPSSTTPPAAGGGFFSRFRKAFFGEKRQKAKKIDEQPQSRFRLCSIFARRGGVTIRPSDCGSLFDKNPGGVLEDTRCRYPPACPSFPLTKIATDWKNCGTRIKLLR